MSSLVGSRPAHTASQPEFRKVACWDRHCSSSIRTMPMTTFHQVYIWPLMPTTQRCFSACPPWIPLTTARQSCKMLSMTLVNWGTSWIIAFEPAKSQAMTIDHHRPAWDLPAVQFAGVPLNGESNLKLLGVTLDSQLSHRNHLRTVAIRAHQRLGLLRKASPLLDSRSRATVYRGFVRPVMEYFPLVWMGAADCHLQRLDQTQPSALHLIGPGAMLQSLSIRRMVAACTYIYKLLCSNPTSPLRRLLPPSQAPRPAHV